MQLSRLKVPPGFRVVITIDGDELAKPAEPDDIDDPVTVEIFDGKQRIGGFTSRREELDRNDEHDEGELVQIILDGAARPRPKLVK